MSQQLDINDAQPAVPRSDQITKGELYLSLQAVHKELLAGRDHIRNFVESNAMGLRVIKEAVDEDKTKVMKYRKPIQDVYGECIAELSAYAGVFSKIGELKAIYKENEEKFKAVNDEETKIFGDFNQFFEGENFEDFACWIKEGLIMQLRAGELVRRVHEFELENVLTLIKRFEKIHDESQEKNEQTC